ncbi:MAG: hypothetical protein Q8N21_02190 [bacterium]|nr:hypothetical protein [bacterium]
MKEKIPQETYSFSEFDENARKAIIDVIKEIQTSIDTKRLFHPSSLIYWGNRLDSLVGDVSNEDIEASGEWTKQKRMVVIKLISEEMLEMDRNQNKPSSNDLNDWGARLDYVLYKSSDFLNANADAILKGKHLSTEEKNTEQ